MSKFSEVSVKDSSGNIWELETNGGMPVNIQDQTSRAVDLCFIQAQGTPTTLSVQADPNDSTITVASTTGFVDKNVVGIFSPGGDFYFGRQVGAPAGNVITLNTPIDVTFPIGNNCITAIDNMNVDGSSVTQIFQVGPVGVGSGVQIDITRLLGFIQDNAAMSTDKFGAITGGLTNGVVLRLNNTIIHNIWNIRTNGEIGLLTFDAMYIDNAGGGTSYGLNFRNTYAGPSRHGVVLRLGEGETLEILIQDNLSSLEIFKMMAQGHVVTN